MAVRTITVLALGATPEARLPRKGENKAHGTPLGIISDSSRGYVLPPSFGGQCSSSRSYLELGGSSVAGWHSGRAGRGRALCPARRCQPPPCPLRPRKPIRRPTYRESGLTPAPAFTLA